MLRPADQQDLRFLRDMLRHAYHWRLSESTERPVYRYVRNWGRAGDAGVIALEGPHAYGAAWYRLFTEDEPGFGFVDEQTPELTIAVVPSRRGLYARSALRAGDLVNENDIVTLRPATLVAPGDWSRLVGGVVSRDIPAGAPFVPSDLAGTVTLEGAA